MKKINLFFSFVLFQLMVVFTTYTLHAGGETAHPRTISETFNLETIETLYMTHTKADIVDNKNSAHGLPDWAGFSLKTYITPDISGNLLKWGDSSKSWVMRASSPGSPTLSLVIEDANLAPNSILYVYSEYNPSQYFAIKAEEIVGGYISTPPAIGDALIIEYYEPDATDQLQGTFAITDLVVIVNGYEAFLNETKNLGSADECLININCEEGDDWQTQKRGIARILLRSGSQWGWCSGSLINNTAQDGTPYFLTALHCGQNASDADRNVWQFFFNFERPGCANTGTPPQNLLIGCQLRAGGPITGSSDFQLLELNSMPPESWNPYYNGWDRNNTPSPSGVGIHHPAGDAMKISTYTTNTVSSTPTISGQTMAPNAAWRVNWAPTVNGHSVTEGGSSGSPLFNNNGLIMGKLSGGSSTCTSPNFPDFYGKFSYSWESHGTTDEDKLKPWLDPLDTGVMTLNGLDPYADITPGFTANKFIVNIEEEVTFLNTTFGGEPETFEWDFGEDAEPLTAEGFGPHTVFYTSSGYKDVTLIIDDTIVYTKENFIYVRGIQTATFHVTDQQGDPIENVMITVSPSIQNKHIILEEKNIGKDISAEQKKSEQIQFNHGKLSAGNFEPVFSEKTDKNNKAGQWIKWDNGENFTGIGTDNAANFSVASRWEPSDLADFEEYVITSIRFFPREANCEYTIKIWTGEEATEVYSQTVINPTINTWNDIELNTPHYIDNTNELWFGYNVNTQAGHPAGADPGPQVPGKGNMILWNGEWSELNQLGSTLTFNWNIHAYIQQVPATVIFTDANGQAEFVDLDGDYDFMVEKENYQTQTGQFTMKGSDVDIPVLLYDDDGKYTITFNLNMYNVEGFDAETDNVYLTGTFTDWADPGSENSILMQRLADKSGNYVILHEDFSVFLPLGWQLESTSSNTWEQVQSITVGQNVVTPVQGTHFTYCNWHGSDAQDEKLITRSMDFSIMESAELSFHFFGNYSWSVAPNNNCDLFVKVSVDGGEWVQIFTETDHPQYTSSEINYVWLHAEIDLSDYLGYSDVKFKFQYVGTDGAQFGIDNVKISGILGEEYFSATLRLEEGSYEYKYFSDAFGDGWDGGEWEGDPNRVLIVDNHKTVEDRWGVYVQTYDLTLLINPLDAGVATGGGTYSEGDEVTINAVPGDDYVFINWTDGDTVVSTDAEYSFLMPDDDLILTANFEEIPVYELTLIANPETGGTLHGEGSFFAGTSVTITANANPDYVFVNWTDGDTVVITDAEYNFLMPDEDLILTANFEEIPVYELTLIANPETGGTPDGEGSFFAGTSVTITANPNQDYVFVNWTDERDNVFSTEEEHTFNMPEEDIILTANFDLVNTSVDILSDEIVIFPNPFNSKITISNATQISRVKITNITGQTVRSLEHHKSDVIQLNTTDLPAGIYMIHFTTLDGMQTVKKIIKR